jgi:hypothetical protein
LKEKTIVGMPWNFEGSCAKIKETRKEKKKKVIYVKPKGCWSRKPSNHEGATVTIPTSPWKIVFGYQMTLWMLTCTTKMSSTSFFFLIIFIFINYQTMKMPLNTSIRHFFILKVIMLFHHVKKNKKMKKLLFKKLIFF